MRRKRRALRYDGGYHQQIHLDVNQELISDIHNHVNDDEGVLFDEEKEEGQTIELLSTEDLHFEKIEEGRDYHKSIIHQQQSFDHHLVEHDVFWLMNGLLKKDNCAINMSKIWGGGSCELILRIFQFNSAFKRKFPTIYKTFSKNGIQLDFIVTEWASSLFCASTNIETLIVFLDFIFLHGWRGFICIGLGIIREMADELIQALPKKKTKQERRRERKEKKLRDREKRREKKLERRQRRRRRRRKRGKRDDDSSSSDSSSSSSSDSESSDSSSGLSDSDSEEEEEQNSNSINNNGNVRGGENTEWLRAVKEFPRLLHNFISEERFMTKYLNLVSVEEMNELEVLFCQNLTLERYQLGSDKWIDKYSPADDGLIPYLCKVFNHLLLSDKFFLFLF